MKTTLKKLVLGVLIGTAAVGGVTMTARAAHAAELCEECDGKGFSGYLVATGEGDLTCSDDPVLLQEQCGL